jgi:predicted phosphodiesterase
MQKYITDYYTFNSANEEYRLYVLGDFHIGGIMHDDQLLRKIGDKIKKDKNALIVFLGDLTELDSSTVRTRKSQIFADREGNFLDETQEIFENIDKIIQKLDFMTPSNTIGVIDGNHYKTLHKIVNKGKVNGIISFTELQYICMLKKLPYLGDGEANIFIKFKYQNSSRTVIPIKIFHGHFSNGVSDVADLNVLLKQASYSHGFHALIKGHSHKPLLYSKEVRYPDMYSDTGERYRTVWLVNTSSTRKFRMANYTDYTEKKGFGPVSFRIPVLKFKYNKSRHFEGITIDGEYLSI